MNHGIGAFGTSPVIENGQTATAAQKRMTAAKRT